MVHLKYETLETLLADGEEQGRTELSLAERQRVADANMAPRKDEA